MCPKNIGFDVLDCGLPRSKEDLSWNALKYVIYDSNKTCWLCLSTDQNDDYYCFYDKINITAKLFQADVSIEEILRNVLGYQVDLSGVPQSLCRCCAEAFLKQFTFSMKCKNQYLYWKATAKIIDEMFDTNININEAETSETDDSNEQENSSKQLIHDNVLPIHQFKVTIPNVMEEKKDKPTVTCPYCHQEMTYDNYKKHIEDKHKTLKYLSCKDCGKCFVHMGNLQTHRKKCTKRLRFWNCKACKKKFSNERSLLIHNSVKCKPIRCPKCKKTFEKDALKSHHIHCTEESKYKRPYKYICTTCSMEFETQRELRGHLYRSHTERNIPCPTCGKLFKTHDAVQKHMTSHTLDRNYTCDMCGKKFVTRRTLENHIRLHTGVRPYTCFFCEEGFVSNSRRLEHLRRKHWEPQFECEQCHKKFVRPTILNKHKKLHCKGQA